MKLKRPVAARILLPVFWSGLFLLIAIPLLLLSAQALRSGDLRFVPLFLSLGAPWGLVTCLVAVRSWQNITWDLIADDRCITLKRGSKTTRITWQQIDACREEASPLERDEGSWVTLRDSHGEALLQWERSWFGHSKRSLAEFDRFTSFVQAKVAQSQEQRQEQRQAERAPEEPPYLDAT